MLRPPLPDRSTRSSQRAKVALAAISAFLALLAAEGVLRLLRIGGERPGSAWFAGGNHPRFLFEPHPETGYRLRPGFTGREIATSGEFDVAVSVDAAGRRDHPHGEAAHPTVIAIGDSMTFGEGVEVGDAFPAVLEAETGYRVLNAGVPGFCSRQMEARLAELLATVRPALVIMTLLPAWDAGRLANPFVYEEGFIVAADHASRVHLIGGNLYAASVDLPLIGPATAYLKARSRVARLLVPALGRLGGAKRDRWEPRGSLRHRAEEQAAIFTRAAAQAEASGARYLLVLIDSRSGGQRAARRHLEDALLPIGLQALALDRLRGDAHWDDLHYAKDGHWNAAGHRWVGAALAPVVVSCLERDSGCAGSGTGGGDGA
jgi:hypothetical protein